MQVSEYPFIIKADAIHHLKGIVIDAGRGPLAGLKVVEFAGIGAGPMCGMLLADLGAQVLCVERIEQSGMGIERARRFELLHRGKRSIKVDLKARDGTGFALQLSARADALVESFRPGTMERLGLGPEVCLRENPTLVYGRLTGYGQTGPMSMVAGHDLNYIALAGVLHGIGREGHAPTPPLNLVGDFGGGGMLLALGIVSAVLSARRTGRGQVVDAAMVDGAALLGTSFWGLQAAGIHTSARGTNLLDSGAPHYEVYRCADGEFITVAPLERKFRDVLLSKVGIDAATVGDWDDPAQWHAIKSLLSEVFASRSRTEWCALLEGTDACFAPVLSPSEAARHPHNVTRGTFVEVDGITQPAPAPRFSGTPVNVPRGPGSGEAEVQWVNDWDISPASLSGLVQRGIVVPS